VIEKNWYSGKVERLKQGITTVQSSLQYKKRDLTDNLALADCNH